MVYDNEYDEDSLEKWQAFSFVCDCVEYCDNPKGRHQRFRQVDDEKLADIMAGHVDPGFFDSLTVKNIIHVAKLEMEQQGGTTGRNSTSTPTGAHDDANNKRNRKNKKKQYSQRGLKEEPQKPIQQPWPQGPIRSKVRTNPRTGKRKVKQSQALLIHLQRR
jgi:hypothetical protein